MKNDHGATCPSCDTMQTLAERAAAAENANAQELRIARAELEAMTATVRRLQNQIRDEVRENAALRRRLAVGGR